MPSSASLLEHLMANIHQLKSALQRRKKLYLFVAEGKPLWMQVWERSPGGADTSFFDTVWGAIDEVRQANDVFKVLMQLNFWPVLACKAQLTLKCRTHVNVAGCYLATLRCL